MVIGADSPSPNTVTAATNSPRKNLPSPWAQVVRGAADSEPLHHQSLPSSSSSSSSFSADSDSSDADKANNAKKPAWKMPPNDVAEVGPVMGAVSWPPLSDAAKPSVKLTSDSAVVTADGSHSTTQVSVTPVSSHTQANSDVKPSPTMYNDVPNRQRSVKQGGSNSNGHAHVHSFTNPTPNLLPSPPLPPPFPVVQIPPSTFSNGAPGPSPRDHFRNNNWDVSSPVGGFGPPPMNEQRSPSSRRGHFGHHPRGRGGDGLHHNNYGSRRDNDRLNNANNRDARVPQQRMSPRGLIRLPPPNHAPFMGPQPLQPFVNPAGFPEYYYFPTLQLESFGRMPFFTHAPPPAMFFLVAETPLIDVIIKQIDYYFSDANLVKDNFLRSNMDEHGWVPINLIASFPRVKSLTSNVELILDSVRTSSVVEVQGDKLRRRSGWTKWLPSTQRGADSSSISPGGSSYNNIAAEFEKITLDGATLDGATLDKVNSILPQMRMLQKSLPVSLNSALVILQKAAIKTHSIVPTHPKTLTPIHNCVSDS